MNTATAIYDAEERVGRRARRPHCHAPSRVRKPSAFVHREWGGRPPRARGLVRPIRHVCSRALAHRRRNRDVSRQPRRPCDARPLPLQAIDRSNSRFFAQRRARRWSRTGAAHGGPRTRKRSPGYDADGNLTEKVEPGGRAWRYEWSAVGMLARVVLVSQRRSC
jgi:YD repeat-containing protein